MANGWTGGQYSLWRACTGLYLLVLFARLIPYGTELFSHTGLIPDAAASPLSGLFPNVLRWFDSPAMVTSILVIAVLLSGLLAVGLLDRLAALGVWYVLACMIGRNPLILNPSLPLLGWLLLAHALAPRAPYGSVSARGRTDPGAGWHMPPRLFAAAWIIMATAYLYSGYTKLVSPSWLDGSALSHVLENPLARPTVLRTALLEAPPITLKIATWAGLAAELLFAPLALFAAVRPIVWLVLLLMHVALLVLINFAELSLGMILLHLFTFDPNWVRPLRPNGGIVFYDGTCGLCHRFVRFLLAEDRRDAPAFAFAPLAGETFARQHADRPSDALPDSVIVQTSDGHWLVRSSAVLYVLGSLGGLWRVLAVIMYAIPRPLRDIGYDVTARVRHTLFARPHNACPLMPTGLRERFQP